MSHPEGENPALERMLREIAASRPSLSYISGEEKDEMVVALPHGCSIEGDLENDEDITYLCVQSFLVRDELQRQGIGTRLLRSFTAEGKARGAMVLYGEIGRPAALRTRAKVFGVENLIYYDPDTEDELELTFEEAIKVVEAPETYLSVAVDLRMVDTEGWERPILTREPLEP